GTPSSTQTVRAEKLNSLFPATGLSTNIGRYLSSLGSAEGLSHGGAARPSGMKSPGPPGLTSLHTRRLGLRRRKLARLDHGLTSGRFVTAVAEGLVRRMSATAEADRGAARQIKRLALRVVARELSLDQQ